MHANSSTFDEMRAREIKVERGRRTCVGRISGSALSCGRVERLSGRRRGRRMDGRFCHTFFHLSGNRSERAGSRASRAGEQGERAHSCISSTLFREVSPSVPLSVRPSILRQRVFPRYQPNAFGMGDRELGETAEFDGTSLNTL